jgi:uncharacterized membrane protein
MASPPSPHSQPPEAAAGFAPVLERNIAALLEQRRHSERTRSRSERLADAVSRFTGSMPFVYLHLALFGAWIGANLGWTPRLEFDPTFVVLAMFDSVEAIFLSTFVLITQSRLASAAERRADLDLQISLLAEHEITRLIQLVSAIGAKVGVHESADPSLEPLKQEVEPRQVLERIEAVARERR